jgi:basic membrane protein A
MKKLFLSFMIAICGLALVACQPQNSYEIAMITDYGDITDQSFNQTTWEAVQAYAQENGKTYAYYKPAGDSTAERVAKIEQAIAQGAKVIVMPGFAFAGAIYECQDLYPEVKFIALDVAQSDVEGCFYVDPYAPEPELIDPNNKPHISANVVCVVFQEEEAGYLAGYAAVKNGERNLGFLGGMAVPAVIRYGYGYVQGVADAAEELGVEVNLWYVYGGQFFGDATIKVAMDQWVAEGCETIFACGGGIFTSAVEAMEGKENCHLIGVDTDQSKSLPDVNVLTSAMKGLTDATVTCLDEFYGDWTVGGQVITYGLKTNTEKEYVGLPRDTWSMENFTIAQYNEVLAKIRSGEITIDANVGADLAELAGEHIVIKNDNAGGSLK